MGQGDLNLPKIFFDLLMLGSEKPQVQFLAIQMVVDYYAQGHRAESDLNTRVYNKRPMSVTRLADNLSETELQTAPGKNGCSDGVSILQKFS